VGIAVPRWATSGALNSAPERLETTLKLDLLADRQRTHYCGELRKAHAGETVFLAGWVDVRRDLGNLIFLDVRDHTGRIQVVCNPAISAKAHDRAEEVRPEYVVGVEGEVVARTPDTVNAQLATGEVEVMARSLLVLNEAKTPPFPIEDETKTSEETRLRYRYLDLRRRTMQRKLRLRHQASQIVRQHMSENRFVEIETPFLTRSTPEGARDYLVPSRVHHGHFYALPQSPQLFKQILMISGFDRYFQIVRCFRDEDQRADRQAEFTQIDVEIAFPQREVLFDIIEHLMEKLFALVDVKVELPFPRMDYETAMERYGSDKPHLGIDLAWKRIGLTGNPLASVRGFKTLKALRIPHGAGKISRSQMDKYQATLQSLGVANSATIEVKGSDIQSRLSKAVGEESLRGIAQAVEAAAGDLIMVIGAEETTRAASHKLDEASGWFRLELAEKFELLKPCAWKFLWVVDFPMFEYDEKEKRFAAMHHPFTSPREEDLDKLEFDPAAVKARAYDLVLNGSEIGGGSIRIHRQDIQRRVFSVLGLPEEKARERFGFFLDALEYGTPPHGGIALGYDRIIALMAGESNIREVIAFPKTASAIDLMCDAPATVEPEQLEELGLEIKTRLPGT
jgi:aspartyl-tRNA synthetase